MLQCVIVIYFTQISLQSVRCPPLDHPERGQVTIDADRTPGSEAMYSCDGGFNLLGSPTRVCLTNGTWSNMPPTCSSSMSFN